MISFQEAFDLVLRHAGSIPVPGTETLPLEQALGRVLAAPLLADRDQPPFHRSTRDGYAVHSASFQRDRRAKVNGFLPAGQTWTGSPLAPGSAIEIMTGAPLPEGADAVVMLEHVTRDGEWITLHQDRATKPGDHFVPAGAEAKAGAAVLPAGIQIGPAEISLAASLGGIQLAIYRKPTVAILATGDELVEAGYTPAAHQIRNSNSYALAALVEETGGEALRMPIARDTRESLRECLEQARQSELILLSGGVSAGRHDLVEDVLAELGAEFFFTAVAIQPGKPAVFGHIPDGPFFFGLPGNPVSTQVTFLLFAAPLLRALCGQAMHSPRFVQAAAAEPLRHKEGLTRFLPARLESTFPQPAVRLVPWQGSGDLASNAHANCYAVLPADRELIGEGEAVTILLR